MNKPEDKKKSYLEYKVDGYKRSAQLCAISLGVALLGGFTFDYGIVDEVMFFGGMFSLGYQFDDGIRYVKYCYDGIKSKKDKK